MNEGFGLHLWDVPLSVLLSEAYLKVGCSSAVNKTSNISLQEGFVSAWLSNVAYMFVKLTFFILYWNIFKPFRWLKIGIIGGVVVFIGFYFICTIISLVEDAPPPGRTWLENATKTQNDVSRKLSVPLGACAVVSDVYILLLPISGVLQLQLSSKKRFAIIMVFMTGVGYGTAFLLKFEDA